MSGSFYNLILDTCAQACKLLGFSIYEFELLKLLDYSWITVAIFVYYFRLISVEKVCAVS